MKNNQKGYILQLVILIAAILLIIIVDGVAKKFDAPGIPALNETNNTTSTSTATTTPGNEEDMLSMQKTKIFFIAIDDNGRRGEKIGCNDSVVSVERNIQETRAPLKYSLEALLKEKKYDVEMGLVNVLYQSDLKIEKITLVNGKASIYLIGEHKLGGVCDTPRFKAQLEETALQFNTIRQVEFFINNRPIDEVLSLK